MSGVPGFAFSIVLAMSAVLAAIAARNASVTAKTCIDAAAIFYALIAIAQVSAHTIGDDAVAFATLIVLAMAPPVLAVAAYDTLRTRVRSLPAMLVFGASGVSAAAAILTPHPAFAFLPLIASVVVMIMLSADIRFEQQRRALILVTAAVALLASATAFIDAGSQAFSLFASVAVTGVALAVAPASGVLVEHKRQRWTRRTLAVRRKR
jgi:hypothetical protein